MNKRWPKSYPGTERVSIVRETHSLQSVKILNYNLLKF